MIFKNLILKKTVKDEKVKSHPYTIQGFKENIIWSLTRMTLKSPVVTALLTFQSLPDLAHEPHGKIIGSYKDQKLELSTLNQNVRRNKINW